MYVILTQVYSAFNIKRRDTRDINDYVFLTLRCDW